MNEPSIDTYFLGFRVPLTTAAMVFHKCSDSGMNVRRLLNDALELYLIKKGVSEADLSDDERKWISDTRNEMMDRRMRNRKLRSRTKKPKDATCR